MKFRDYVSLSARILLLALSTACLATFEASSTPLIRSFKSFDHQGPSNWHFAASFGSFYDTTDCDFEVPGKYSIHIYRNSGYGAFALSDSIDWGSENVTTVDLNNDGYTDIVSKGTDGQSAGCAGAGDGYDVFMDSESAPGTFTPHHCPVDTSGEGGYAGFASYFGTCADLNGDGYPDCAHWIFDGQYVGLTNHAASVDSLVPNPNGDGVLYVKTACTLGGQDGVLVDLDSDGDLDIVTANGIYYSPTPPVDTGWATVFTNNGSGSFTRAYDLDTNAAISNSSWALRITSGLMNADSYLDVVIGRIEDSATDSLVFYRGSSNGTLSRDTCIALESVSSLTTADVDDDGHMDIIAGADDSIIVFYNDGTRHFSKETVKADGSSFGQIWYIATSDVDRDGDIDLLVSDLGGAKSWVGYNHAVVDTAGDCNADGTIDIYDFIALTDYLYYNGSDPTPWYAGDCNFDGRTDDVDVSYLYDYLFNSGPTPFIH